MRILFACGGTGGHINPALAVANYIRSQQPDAVIRFAGNPNGMEARLVPKAGFDFVPFKAMGIQRRLTPYNIYRNVKSVCLLMTAEPRAKKVIRAFAPDLVGRQGHAHAHGGIGPGALGHHVRNGPDHLPVGFADLEPDLPRVDPAV